MSDRTRRARAVERLADALQECLDVAVESGTAEAVTQVNKLNVRMDRQDETLRMMWNQAKGKGTLPIDS